MLWFYYRVHRFHVQQNNSQAFKTLANKCLSRKIIIPKRQVANQASCLPWLTWGLIAIFHILIFIKWILRVFRMINHGLLILIDYCCGTLLYQSGHFYNSRSNGVFRSGTFDRETCVDNLIIIVFFSCSLPYVPYVTFCMII